MGRFSCDLDFVLFSMAVRLQELVALPHIHEPCSRGINKSTGIMSSLFFLLDGGCLHCGPWSI